MSRIYYLNPGPNPFWDFVAGLEDHPFFSGPPGNPRRRHGPPSPPQGPPLVPAATDTQPQPEISEKARGKQATVEDPPEIDPSTIKPQTENVENRANSNTTFRGRGRFARAFEHEDKQHETQTRANESMPFRGRGRFGHAFEHDNQEHEGHRARGGHLCKGGRGRAEWNGPPPFMSGHPFFARPPWARHGPPPPGPPGHEHRERHSHRHPHPHGPPPHARGSHDHPRRQSPPRPNFNLGEFLNNLGNKLGIDLSNAAEGLGLAADRFTAGRTNVDVNFEPRADIFENKNLYTIHLSVPGAKKSDVGVDYDGDHSVIRITGVVHRPDVDEQMMSELIVDGRKRETGVFEKAIRLGTRREPANIDVARINAKMTDGILVVKVPKIENASQKREVPITTDPVVGEADYEDEYSEKPVLFDAEEQDSVAATETTEVPTSRREEISLIDMKDNDAQVEVKEKEPVEPAVYGKEKDTHQEDERLASNTKPEQLPAYSDHEEDDWERFSDASGEGEYININVD